MHFRILHGLSSRKLAVALFITLIILFVTGSFLPKVTFMSTPQQELLAKNNPWLFRLATALTPPEIVKHWGFGLLTGILFISTACCSILRIGRNPYRQNRITAEIPIAGVVLPVGMPEEVLTARIAGLLRSARWDVTTISGPGGGTLISGYKGSKGFWGSILFHASLLIIILCGLLSMYAAFYAGVVVTEGQILDVVEENLVDITRLPEIGQTAPGFRIKMESFVPYLEQDRFFTQYFAILSFLDPLGGNVRREEVKINHAAGYRGFKVALSRYGFAPLLRITDNETGQELLDSYVNLVVPDPASHDSVGLPPGYPHLMFRFFPDAEIQGRAIKNRSPLPKKPVFLVWAGGEEDRPLPLGGTVKLQKVTVNFGDLRYWASFRISRDPGEPVIYLGFILGILGLLVRFLDPPKTIRLKLLQDDSQVEISIRGSSRYFPALFQEEVQALAGKLEKELKG